MRRNLSTTTALVTSLALVLPATFPASAQQLQGRDQIPIICTDDMTEQECNRAIRRAARIEARQQGQTGDQTPDDQAPADQAPADQAPADQAPDDQTPDDQAPAQDTFGGDDSATGDGNGTPTPTLEDLEQQLGDDGAQPMIEPTQPPTDAEAEVEAQAETDDAGAPGAEQTEPATGESLTGDEPLVPTEGQLGQDEPPRDAESLEQLLGGEADAEVQGETEVDAQGQTDPEALFRGDDVATEGPSSAETEAASGEADASMATVGALGDEAQVVEEFTEQVTEENSRSSSEGFRDRRPRDGDRDGDGDGDGDRDGDRDGHTARDSEDDGIPDFLRGAIVGAAGALIVGALLRGDREVVSTAPDRVIVRDRYGNLQVLRDDDAILRRPGSEVTTRRYQDGSTDTIVTQPDGSQVITVRSPEGRVVKRVAIARNGTRTVLFDDTVRYEPVVVADLPPVNRTYAPQVDPRDEQALRAALMRESQVGRSFSLNQVRQIERVRYLAPAVQLENITFETGSAAISPTESQQLLALGELMSSMIAENPYEVFLIEGHTDAQGSAAMNLTLSDRRAESVALALTEYFGVSPANMVLQGYGESDLRVATTAAERANRRVVVRRITQLLQVAQEG